MRLPRILVLIDTRLHPAQVLARFDADMAKPLLATLKFKPKSSAVQNEFERNEDLIRSCFRLLDRIQALDEGGRCAELPGLLDMRAKLLAPASK